MCFSWYLPRISNFAYFLRIKKAKMAGASGRVLEHNGIPLNALSLFASHFICKFSDELKTCPRMGANFYAHTEGPYATTKRPKRPSFPEKSVQPARENVPHTRKKQQRQN